MLTAAAKKAKEGHLFSAVAAGTPDAGAVAELVEASLNYDAAVLRHAIKGKSWVAGDDLDALYATWIGAARRMKERLLNQRPARTPDPSPAGSVDVCEAVGPHHGDRCNRGRIQSPNAQFTQPCGVCGGTGRKSAPDPSPAGEDVLERIDPANAWKGQEKVSESLERIRQALSKFRHGYALALHHNDIHCLLASHDRFKAALARAEGELWLARKDYRDVLEVEAGLGDEARQHLAAAEAKLALAERERDGIIDHLPSALVVRVREGGGPENRWATLAASVAGMWAKLAAPAGPGEAGKETT